MLLRILKLGVLTLLGYAAYQFIRGILEGEESIRAQAPRGSGPVALTGGGSGRVVTTEDAAGTSAPHRVGRGVVHR
jgi:hypothetical protein